MPNLPNIQMKLQQHKTFNGQIISVTLTKNILKVLFINVWISNFADRDYQIILVDKIQDFCMEKKHITTRQ